LNNLDGGERLEAEIRITGRVQGVGFRPFIYRKAVENGLRGYIINLGDAGVEVVVEGERGRIEGFLDGVEEEAPQVSEIEGVTRTFRPYRGRFDDFRIDRSQDRGEVASGVLPPDIGICPQCLWDMGDPEGRWYEYPFTACAWCGPRFTAVRRLPYDRERTHMAGFPMCKECDSDYHDPMDRRFDAQGITCPICGPRMALYDPEGRVIDVEDVFAASADLLRDGKILAVKGIGGIHIAALATDDGVVGELRRRKRRPYQPFALMSPDLEAVRLFSDPDEEETGVLRSWRKPIVLLKMRGGVISGLVAPGLDRVGVMLPYSGIHVMLFKRLGEPALIMTSGNRPGLPMAITNEAAFEELGGIVDCFLLHDREIVNRCDDSVLRLIEGNRAFIRRSRGYVPDPIEIPIEKGFSLAVGAELRNAGAVALNGKCYTTQYLGDITNLESLEFERGALERLCDLLNVTCNPDVIGCDLHPGYMTSQLAGVISQEAGAPVVKSQHHHAHIASVSAENMVEPEEPVVGIALDGAGYGTDGAVWGGEVLISNLSGFERVGQLEYLPMPGGDLCAYYPYRMLVSALTKAASDEEIRDITENHASEALPHGEREFELVLRQARERGVMETSSSGRFLDAVSSLLGLTYERTYEGEPAMRLEAMAARGSKENPEIDLDITNKNGIYELKTAETLLYMANSLENIRKQDLALFGQRFLAEGVSEMAIRVAQDQGIGKVGLSGGVFVNGYITRSIVRNLEGAGLRVLLHRFVPPGDGGSAVGQSVLALSHVT